MFVWNNNYLQNGSHDDVRGALCLLPNVPEIKEKQKKCLNLSLKRKEVLGLLPVGFGKRLIY